MTIEQLLIQYEDKLRELHAGLLHARSCHTIAVVIFAVSAALLLMLSLCAVRQQQSFLWLSLPLPLVAALAWEIRPRRQSQNRMFRLQAFYGRAVNRLKDHWARSGTGGGEFSEAAHPYARDLNIFGEGSLFELLCTVRTAIGQRGLAEYLLRTPPLEETLLRQEAVRELKERADLRERVALLGDFEFFEYKRETFDEWLDSPALSLGRPLRVLALITSATLASMILIGFATNLVPWSSLDMWIFPILALQSIIGLFSRGRVNRTLGWLHPISVEAQVLRQALRLLEDQQFRSVKLRDLADRAQNSSRKVRKLERLLNALQERNKPWFYGPSLLLLFGTQVCMAIDAWRTEHGAALRIWLDVWAEFEALNALATTLMRTRRTRFPSY